MPLGSEPDEDEDDPWQFLTALQQDCVTDEMTPPRVKTADFIRMNMTESATCNFVAIDPCLSLLPRKLRKSRSLEDGRHGLQKVDVSKANEEKQKPESQPLPKLKPKIAPRPVVLGTPCLYQGLLENRGPH